MGLIWHSLPHHQVACQALNWDTTSSFFSSSSYSHISLVITHQQHLLWSILRLKRWLFVVCIPRIPRRLIPINTVYFIDGSCDKRNIRSPAGWTTITTPPTKSKEKGRECCKFFSPNLIDIFKDHCGKYLFSLRPEECENHLHHHLLLPQEPS